MATRPWEGRKEVERCFYLEPVFPYTQQPVANQWDTNVHMMNFLRDRYRQDGIG